MTGTTTELNLATAQDSDDTEQYLTVNLVGALAIVDALFNASTGHDHSGAHKGKPVIAAGLGAGSATGAALGSDVVTLTGAQILTNKTLTSPHMTGAVVDSGGLTITAGGLMVTAGVATFTGGVSIAAALAHTGTTIGFYNTAPTGKPTVAGSRGANAALASLLTNLALLGLVTDSSTA